MTISIIASSMDSKKDADKINKAVPKRRFPRVHLSKKTAAIGIVIVVAIIGVGGWLVLRHQRHTQKLTGATLTNSIYATTDQAQAGKYDAAIANLQSLAKQATTKDDKLSIYTRLAAFSTEKGDKQKALEYYQTAAQYGPKDDPNIILGIATVADAAGNEAVAIQYYQKIITIYQGQVATQPYLQPAISKYQARVTALGSK
jgi:tetratricopeptide (TPR) repeat protein